METKHSETYQAQQTVSQKISPPEKFCARCGEKLLDGQYFCPKCGKKCRCDVDSSLNSTGEHFPPHNTPQKRRQAKAILIGVVALVVIVAIAAIFLKLFRPMNDYLAEGDYEKAYSIASESEKNEVVKENIIAYISKDIPSMLKNPNSFELLDAWYDSTKRWIVLYVSGTNSYGGTVASYYYYTPERDGNGWELYCTVSDLEEDAIPEVNYSDDFYDKFEIVIQNAAKSYISDVISDNSFKLGKNGIKNINHLFDEGVLNDVMLLDAAVNSST